MIMPSTILGVSFGSPSFMLILVAMNDHGKYMTVGVTIRIDAIQPGWTADSMMHTGI